MNNGFDVHLLLMYCPKYYFRKKKIFVPTRKIQKFVCRVFLVLTKTLNHILKHKPSLKYLGEKSLVYKQ